MYGTHESTQSIEITAGDEYREVTFLLDMRCVTRGTPGSYYGDGAYPPEAPEFELDTVHVLAQDGKPFYMKSLVFEALLGPELTGKMIDAAINEAIESGDFG